MIMRCIPCCKSGAIEEKMIGPNRAIKSGTGSSQKGLVVALETAAAIVEFMVVPPK